MLVKCKDCIFAHEERGAIRDNGGYIHGAIVKECHRDSPTAVVDSDEIVSAVWPIVLDHYFCYSGKESDLEVIG